MKKKIKKIAYFTIAGVIALIFFPLGILGEVISWLTDWVLILAYWLRYKLLENEL